MILVTGGTGLVGSHLLYFLLKKNEKIRAIHRKESDKDSIKKIFLLYTSEAELLFEKIEWVEASITDIPSLSLAFTDITEVYHCAALIRFDPSSYKKLKKTNTEGTANIVNLCIAHHIQKLCYVSSIATLGSTLENRLISEKSPWNPDEKNNVYAITKYGAEMEVWRATQEGVDAIIVNPGVIFGVSPTGGNSNTLLKIAASGIPFYPSGTMGVVDVMDVVQTMIALMGLPIKNEQYILVSENISYKKFLIKAAPLFGKKPPTKKLSKRFMFFLSFANWLLHKLFGVQRKLPKAMVRAMFNTSLYDASKIKATLNLQFIPLEKTLQRILKERKDS